MESTYITAPSHVALLDTRIGQELGYMLSYVLLQIILRNMITASFVLDLGHFAI